MKTAISWILLLLLAVGLAAWLLWPEAGPAGGPRPAAPERTTGAAERGAVDRRRVPEPIATERFAGGGAEARSERIARSFPVRCLLPDGGPAAGARLEVYDASLPHLDADDHGPRAVPPGAALTVRTTDADGRADLGGATVGARVVVARLGEYGAMAEVTLRPRRAEATEASGTPPRPLEMPLSRFRELTVAVTTARGRPVPQATVVALDPGAFGPLSHSFQSGSNDAAMLHHGRTDARGLVRFLVTENEGGEWFRRDQVEAFVLTLGEAREIGRGQWVDGEARIELVAPATRLLDVVVTDAADRPLKEPFLVELTADLQETWEEWTEDVSFDFDAWESLYVGLDAMTGCWGARLPRGAGVLGRVVAERRYSVKVSGRGRDPAIHVVRVPLGGPRHALRLRAGPEKPFVRVRLEDPEGRPCCGVVLLISREEDGKLRSSEEFVTDASGCIEDWFHTGTRGRVVIRAPRESVPEGAPAKEHYVEHALVLDGTEEGQVGPEIVLPLDARPALAAGRLVDAAGAPIAGGLVKVVEHDPELDELMDPPTWWQAAGADGHFEVRAVDRVGCRYEISAVARQGVAAPRALSPGAADLVLELSPPPVTTGVVRGRLQLLLPSLTGQVELMLLRESDGLAAWIRRRGDGWFVARDVEPGRYELLATVHDLQAARVGGIEVVAGEERRLEALEIGSEFHEVTVRVLDAKGAPITAARVEWQERTDDTSRDPWRRDALTDRRGRARLVVLRDLPLRVSIERDGYPAFASEKPTFPLEVRLRKELEVRLEWSVSLRYRRRSRVGR